MEIVASRAAIDRLSGLASDDVPRNVPRFVELALILVALVVVSGWLTLAAIHASDDYRMTHTHGVWVAAAESVREGRFYPPLFDGEHYAGTRYMPVPILLNAAASAIAGDALTGGKILAAVLMTLLLATAVGVLRGLSCPWPVALALAAGVVATEAGLEAATTIGGDLIPAVLQLGAMAIVLRGQGRGSIAGAGVLAGVAVASKLTGTWGLLAVTTWLAAQRRWRPAVLFASVSVVTAAAVLGAVQVLTSGGLFAHLQAFSAAGVQSLELLLRAPSKLLYQLTSHAFGTVVLVPLAVLGVILWNWRRLSVVQIGLGYAVLLLLVVYTDIGTGLNQLLDVVLLTALAAGALAGRAATGGGPAARVVLLAISLAVLWATTVDGVRTIAHDLRLAAASIRAGRTATPTSELIARTVGPGEAVFSADPSIEVALGRRPLVMDPFMLVRLDRSHPEWVDPLIRKIEQRQFDVVVMVVPLEKPELDFWWTDYQLGPRVAQALRAGYRPDGLVGRYFLYRPRLEPQVR